MPKQQNEWEECSLENIFWFSMMEDTQLIWEKDDKYGKTHKRLVELVVNWRCQIKENGLLCTRKLWEFIT